VEFNIYGDGRAKTGSYVPCKCSNMQDHVNFHDFLPTDQIASVMVESDLAVKPGRGFFPLRNEAASAKILEFMAVGIP
jgi:hypothetical protein